MPQRKRDSSDAGRPMSPDPPRQKSPLVTLASSPPPGQRPPMPLPVVSRERDRPRLRTASASLRPVHQHETAQRRRAHAAGLPRSGRHASPGRRTTIPPPRGSPRRPADHRDARPASPCPARRQPPRHRRPTAEPHTRPSAESPEPDRGARQSDRDGHATATIRPPSHQDDSAGSPAHAGNPPSPRSVADPATPANDPYRQQKYRPPTPDQSPTSRTQHSAPTKL